jgi:excisionase family DNA binding protein
MTSGKIWVASSPDSQARRWLDVRAAADYVGSTVSFIRGLIWDGTLPYTRAGKKFIIDVCDLDAYMVREKQRNAA